MVTLSVLVSVLGLLVVAPVPKDDEKGVPYHATKVGTRLVYVTDDHESAEVITDVKEQKGETLVTVGHESKGKAELIRVVAVSDRGLCIVQTAVAELEKPMWLLKLPHVKDQKWDVTLAPVGIEAGTGTATAHGPELVEVPAGKFRAIRVEAHITFLGERRQQTTWYAPGIGMVKQVSGKDVQVLKSHEVKK